jgi:DNA-binding MarR family transcriptional regulator|tara:strand:- start:660 stop:1178 length:519 start_codon:yes stop_codon:yes gene_type:complete
MKGDEAGKRRRDPRALSRSVIDETNESREPSAATVAAWAQFVRIGQSILAMVEADLKRQGFPPLAHYDALLELRRAGPKGLRPNELQHEMLLAQYSISRLVERLVHAGYVGRGAAEGDGRGQILRITPAGRTCLKSMWPVYADAIQRHFGARLDIKDAERFAAILTKLQQSC